MNRGWSSQRTFLWRSSLYFWKKGYQVLLPMRRWTGIQGWPQHRQCPHWSCTALLYLSTTESPGLVTKHWHPQHGKQSARDQWNQGNEARDRLGTRLQYGQQWSFLFKTIVPSVTIFLHAFKIISNSGNSNQACLTTSFHRHWKEEWCFRVFLPPWKWSWNMLVGPSV